MRSRAEKHLVWLMPSELRHLEGRPDPRKAFGTVAVLRHGIRALPAHDNRGDQAGSDAKLGVGVRCSLRPVTSTVNSAGPPPPPGSRKNMMTRPFGDQVGPSLWNPSVRIRSPEPSGCMMPIANLLSPCLVNAM